MHLFVDHLTVIDSAYLCPTNGLVGESWICDIALEGALDANSMVMDFGRVKKSIKAAIDQWVDHTLIVPEQSPNLTLTPPPIGGRLGGGRQQVPSSPLSHPITLSFTFGAGDTLTHTSPAEALCLLPVAAITPEAIATYLETRLREVVPASVERIHVSLRTEPDTGPYYHYVHGLKKHDGNCQRIAHGHRSRLHITNADGTANLALAQSIANQLNYKYIGTRADIVSTDATHTRFAYTAPQGRYELTYPSNRCHLIDTDSTVECIAAHLAALAGPGHTVRAYEGVDKGAIARLQYHS